MTKKRRVTRVVIVDFTRGGGGRIMDKWWQDGLVVSTQLQDDDRTLKIFIEEEKK